MTLLTSIRNKVLATVIRTLTVGTYPTHEDEVLEVPSRDDGRTIKAHVYRPTNSTKPTPVLINLHGSGFVNPMHGSDDEFCLRVKQDTPYTVVDVRYRLAPENPFPAGPHDAEDVVKWVLAHPDEYDTARISVSGFSAGAIFALALSGHVFPPGTIRHVLAFYPPTDISKDPYSRVAPDTSGKPIPPFIAGVFNDCYALAGLDRKQPLMSPCYIDGERFPNNVLIITGATDSLAPEAEELASKIAAVPGKHVVQRRFEKCDHAWDKNCQPGTQQAQAKDDAYGMAVDMLRM